MLFSALKNNNFLLRFFSDVAVLLKLWFFSHSHSILGVPIALRTFIFQHTPHSIVAFFCLSSQISLRVEMLNGSLNDMRVQLRSYQAFKIAVSWRGKERIVEKQSEHLEDVLAFFKCSLVTEQLEWNSAVIKTLSLALGHVLSYWFSLTLTVCCETSVISLYTLLRPLSKWFVHCHIPLVDSKVLIQWWMREGLGLTPAHANAALCSPAYQHHIVL